MQPLPNPVTPRLARRGTLAAALLVLAFAAQPASAALWLDESGPAPLTRRASVPQLASDGGTLPAALNAPTPAPAAVAAEDAAPGPLDWLDAALQAAGWPPELWPTVRAVAWCESRHQPGAQNGPYVGLMQMHVGYHSWRSPTGELWSVHGNLAAAWHLFREQGWAPWSCA